MSTPTRTPRAPSGTTTGSTPPGARRSPRMQAAVVAVSAGLLVVAALIFFFMNGSDSGSGSNPTTKSVSGEVKLTLGGVNNANAGTPAALGDDAASQIMVAVGCVQFGLDLLQPALIGGACLCIGLRTGVGLTQRAARGVELLLGRRRGGGWIGEDEQIEHMELAAWVVQQCGQIVQAFGVFEAAGLSLVHQRPGVAVPPEDIGVLGLRKASGCWLSAQGRRRSSPYRPQPEAFSLVPGDCSR